MKKHSKQKGQQQEIGKEVKPATERRKREMEETSNQDFVINTEKPVVNFPSAFWKSAKSYN